MSLEASMKEISEISKLKNHIITSLALESQYAINKIFINPLDFESSSKVDIDCFYEFIYAHSKVKSITFLEAANILFKKNLIDGNIFYYTRKLREILQGEKNERRKITN